MLILLLTIPRKSIRKIEYASEVNEIVSKVNEIAVAVDTTTIAVHEVGFKNEGDYYSATEQNYITDKVNELAGLLLVAGLSFGSLISGNDWTSDEFNELVDKINELAMLAMAYTTPSPAIYWGVKSTLTVLTKPQILAGINQMYTPGNDITIPFSNSSPQVPWAAWPATETGITNYFINAFDFGLLGPDGTFSAPVTIGDMLFVQTNYLTQLDTAIFKH